MKLFIELIASEDGDSKIAELQAKLKELNASCDYIKSNLGTFFKMIRIQSPRYFYSSDEQMLTLCSLMKFPKSLAGFVSNLFKGLKGINIGNVVSAGDTEFFEVTSVVTRNDELVTFRKPLEVDLATNAEIPLISMVKGLEASIFEYLEAERRQQLPILANLHFDFTLIFNHWQEKMVTFQMLGLCMQVLFDFELTMQLQDLTQTKAGQRSTDSLITNPLERLAALRTRLTNSLGTFIYYPIRYLKGKMKDPKAVRSLCDFTMMIQNFVATLDHLILHGVRSTDDARFALMPKYSVVVDKKVTAQRNGRKSVQFDEIQEVLERELEPSDGRPPGWRSGYSTSSLFIEEYYGRRGQKLVLALFEHTLDYKNEILTPSKSIVVWPLLERLNYALYISLVRNPNVILQGFPHQGKLETVRALNAKVASNYYECDLGFNYPLQTISHFIYGMVSGGYWLAFKNLEMASSEILSVVSSFAEEIRQCLAAGRTKIKVSGEELLIKGSHALFCTYNTVGLRGARQFAELASKISHLFRVVSVHHADYFVIISSLLGLVLDSAAGEASAWTNKLLTFLKMYKSAEVMEDAYLGDAVIQGRRDLSVSDLTLREVCALLNKSVVKYFRSLDLYYESFKERDGKYRIDRAALMLDSEREVRFTTIFKLEVMAWFQLSQPQAAKLSAVRVLFDKIFGDDKTNEKIETQQQAFALGPQVLKAVSAFLEAEPDSNLPFEEERVHKFIEPFVDLIVANPKGRQYIVVGEPNSQKSTLIRLLGFIESELSNVRFPEFWLNLECLSREDIFGEEKHHGILREILLQSNNINLEDKNTTNVLKLNSLFQSNTDLFHLMSDYKDPSKAKGKKNFERHSSWIVVDANSSKNNPLFYAKVNYLMRIFGNLYEQREVNQFVGFSNRIKVIYEMTSLSELEPSHVSEAGLLHIREGLMTPKDRVRQWVRGLSRHHEFFAGISRKAVQVCEEVVLPLLEHLDRNRESLDLIFFINQLSLLNNFLTYFEIMLNEFRKYHTAYKLSESKTNPSFLGQMDRSKIDKVSSNQQFSYGAAMRLAQEAGGTMIASQRNKKAVAKIEDDQVSALATPQDVEDFESRKVEGLAVFCLFGALAPLIFSDKTPSAVFLFDRFCSAYCSKHGIKKDLFADGLFKIVSDKKLSGNVFDIAKYMYDFSKGKWSLWENIKPPTKVKISSSFSGDAWTKDELLRLNCQNSPTFYSADNSNPDDVFCFISPVEKTIVNTSNVSHMRYMLDLFLNYRRNVLLLSDHQQGKSSFLGHVYLRDLIEQRQLITFNFVLQKNVSPLAIQSQIENSLLGMGSNVISPPENKRVVIWVDDLQMSINEEKPESLVRNMQAQGGWFSSNKKSFIKIVDCQFLMTMSLTEYDKETSRQSIASLNSDVLAKTLLLKTHKLSYGELSSVYFEQVRDSIELHAESPSEKFVSRIMKQLCKVVYFNQDRLRALSASASINLSVESFYQLFKTINLIEWQVVSEKPEDVLFVWLKMLMNFFSCDFNLQQIEFETIMKEKQKKMDLIKVTRKSTVFDTTQSQRYSVMINQQTLGQLLTSLQDQDAADKLRPAKARPKGPAALVVVEESRESEGSSPKSSSSSLSGDAKSLKKSSAASSVQVRENVSIKSKKLHSSSAKSRKSSLRSVREAQALAVPDAVSQRERRKSRSERDIPIPLKTFLKKSTQVEKRESTRKEPETQPRESSRALSGAEGDGRSQSEKTESSKSRESASKGEGDESSDDNVDADDAPLFLINRQLPPNQYFQSFINKVMSIKMSETVDLEAIRKHVCFDRKHIFDEVLLKDIRDVRENRQDNDDHTFVVVDDSNERDMMNYMKGTLKGFIKLYPDALFSLKLDGGNFPLFIQHYNMLSLLIHTEYQQLFVSSVKSLFYCRGLVSYISSTLGYPVDYIDMIGNSAAVRADEKLGKSEPYELLLDVICEAFADVWKLKKRIIMLHVPNTAVLPQHRAKLDRIVDLISSVVLNTDMLNQHLQHRLREMIDLVKKDKLYIHYNEYDIVFTIRNRMQARLTFIILNDCTQNFIEELKVDQTGPKREPSLYVYLSDKYTKMINKFTKVVINGIKCLEPEDTPTFYEIPLPFEEIEISPFCARALNIEMNYLRCVDKERANFVLVRPYNESIILHNVLKYTIKMKFSILETDSDLLECERQKNTIVQRVERRIEIIRLEIREIGSQVAAKEKEKLDVLANQEELEQKKSEWLAKKAQCQDTIDRLHVQMAEYMRDDRLYHDLKLSLMDTIKAIREYKEKDVQLALTQSNFFKSKLYSIYAVIYCEMSGVEVPNRLTREELLGLSEESLNRDRLAHYIAGFEHACNNFHAVLIEAICGIGAQSLSEERSRLLCDVVERISANSATYEVYGSIQRILMKMVDSSIEVIKLEHLKAKREVEIERINESVVLLGLQSERADKYVAMIEEGLKDKPALTVKIEERIALLEEKKKVDLETIERLLAAVADLQTYHKKYAVISHPLLDDDVPREALIEVLAAFVTVFSKYPHAVKKKMLFILAKSSGLAPELFRQLPIYEVLSNDSLMTDVMRYKLPCNLNFLTNLSVVDLLQDEQVLLFPLVLDPGKLFVKYLACKHSKALTVDRYDSHAAVADNLEQCIRNGHVYVAVDPSDELLQDVRPVIEWQFRRFSENILIVNNNGQQDVTDTIVFNNKKLHVNKGFYLCVVLETLPLARVDQYVLSKLIVLDNDLLNEHLFIETVADDMMMNLENNNRGLFLSEYKDKNVQLLVMDKYKQILAKWKDHDILKDTFDTIHSHLAADLREYEQLIRQHDRDAEERAANLDRYVEVLAAKSADDREEHRFMNYPYGFKIVKYHRLLNRFMPYVHVYWVYYLSIHKLRDMHADIGAINYDTLTYIIKHSISLSDLKVSSVDIDRKSENFLRLFDRIDRQVFTLLSHMLPPAVQSSYVFVLAAVFHAHATPDRAALLLHLNKYVHSYKVLHRATSLPITSARLQQPYAAVVERMDLYYRDKHVHVPLIPADCRAVQELALALQPYGQVDPQVSIPSSRPPPAVRTDSVREMLSYLAIPSIDGKHMLIGSQRYTQEAVLAQLQARLAYIPTNLQALGQLRPREDGLLNRRPLPRLPLADRSPKGVIRLVERLNRRFRYRDNFVAYVKAYVDRVVANLFGSTVSFDLAALLFDPVPQTPPSADIFTFGTVVNYVRADFIDQFMLSLLAAARGDDYRLADVDLDHIHAYSSNKRCTVVVFSQPAIDFVLAMVAAIALKANVKFVLFDCVRGSVEEFRQLLDSSARRNVWVVLCNLDMVPDQLSSVYVREGNALLDRGLLAQPYRLLVVFRYKDRMPIWMNTCHYYFIDNRPSLKNTLLQLSLADVLRYSAGFSMATPPPVSAPPAPLELVQPDDEDPYETTTEKAVLLTELCRQRPAVHQSDRAYHVLKYVTALRSHHQAIAADLHRHKLPSSSPHYDADLLRHLSQSPYLLHMYVQLYAGSLADALSAVHLFRIYLFDMTAGDHLLFDKYLLPSNRLAADPGKTLHRCVFALPTEDDFRAFHVQANDFMVHAHRRSMKTLLMVSAIDVNKLLFDHSSRIEDFDIDTFTQDNSKNDKEIITRFYLNSIEYGYNLIQNHEFRSQMNDDMVKIIDTIIDIFDQRLFEEVHQHILVNTLPPAAANPGAPASKKRFSFIRPPVRDLNSVFYRGMSDDFFASTGFTPRKSKIFMTLNVKEKHHRQQYRRFILAHEYRCVHRCLQQMHEDMVAIRCMIDGSVLSRDKERCASMMNDIANNLIPQTWMHLLAAVNVDVSCFKAMVCSFLAKIDHLYDASVNVRDIYPIINLDRLIDPRGFLSNLVEFNSIQYDVAVADTCIMVNVQPTVSDKHQIYERSMMWTVTGMKVRGGKIDKDGVLVDEGDRQFVHHIGPMHVEFTQFDRARHRWIEGNNHLPLIMNIRFEEEVDLLERFDSDCIETLSCSEVYTPITKRKVKVHDLIDEQLLDIALKEQAAKTRKNSRQPLTFSRRNSGASQKQPEELHVVRLPLICTSTFSSNPLVDSPVYVYCYSKLPQFHWDSRCTCFTVEDSPI